ncbi:bifunctional metallophosphatase/5'-nucleotidase [Planctomycetota bacterium]
MDKTMNGSLRTFAWRAALYCALLVTVSTGVACSDDDETTYGTGRIVILHTNSHSGQAEPYTDPQLGGTIGGLAARATLIQQVRAEVGADLVLLLDSGNLVAGTGFDQVTRGAPDVLAMNAMGYDAAAVGPQDFAFGYRNLRNLVGGPDVLDFSGVSLFPLSGGSEVDFSQGARFPFVATNLTDAASNRTPAPIIGGSVVFRIGEVRVGVIGIASEDATKLGRPPSSLAFNDPVAAAKAALPTDVDLVVALTNQSGKADANLLRQVAQIDVIVGGGSGGFTGIFTRSDSLDTNERVPTLGLRYSVAHPDGVFVRTAPQGATLGRLDLAIVNGAVATADAVNLAVRGVAADRGIEKILEPFSRTRDLARRLVFGTVIATSSVPLQGDVPAIREADTGWGRYVADAVRDRAGADVAFLSAGVFRGSPATPDLTLDEVFSVLPTNEVLVSRDLLGSQILSVLEHAVTRTSSETFLQVSGIEFTWKASASPGQRVPTDKVKIRGGALNQSKSYKVVVNEAVAAGDEGFPVLGGAGGTRLPDFISHVVIDALKKDTAAKGKLDIPTAARILKQ